MSDKNSKKVRTRNFVTVVYPESASENWVETLSESHIPVFISPLHDKDNNPDGEAKKAHYHVMLMYESVHTIEQAKAIFDSIGGVGIETVNSVRGYARYLCHLDNPEKAQYNPADVRSLCGADYNSIIGLPTDRYKAIREMMLFCGEKNVLYYHELLNYACTEREDWFKVLCDSGTYVMKEYIKSKFYSATNSRF